MYRGAAYASSARSPRASCAATTAIPGSSHERSAHSAPEERSTVRPIAEPYSPDNAFLNVPYDHRYEDLFLAFIAGLCSFGLRPRTTLELPGPRRRLDRILELIGACRYSFHDLSRVQLASGVPRFNMPFELGLAVTIAAHRPRQYQWAVFEARPYRLQRSLSDLNGTDPYVHGEQPRRLLVELSNALVRAHRRPTLDGLDRAYLFLRRGARAIKREYGTLLGARAFRDLVVLATDYSDRELR